MDGRPKSGLIVATLEPTGARSFNGNGLKTYFIQHVWYYGINAVKEIPPDFCTVPGIAVEVGQLDSEYWIDAIRYIPTEDDSTEQFPDVLGILEQNGYIEN